MDKLFWRIKDVVSELGVTKRTVYRWIAESVTPVLEINVQKPAGRKSAKLVGRALMAELRERKCLKTLRPPTS